MSFLKNRRSQEQADIWPGFVDALSTVLLVFIFVLVGFISSQIYLSGIIFDKDTSLIDLKNKLSVICSVLDCEKQKNKNLIRKNVDLSKQITNLNNTVETLRKMFSEEEEQRKREHTIKISLEEKIDQLTQQLKDVLTALAAEQKNSEEQRKAIEYIKKENIKLNELSKLNSYRSEFFNKLQSIVGNRAGIKVSGDRFIFQSELFFNTASDNLSEEGQKQVSELAKIIQEIGEKIPSEIKWILRVDGHTDKRPIAMGARFPTNWELSAARAISVVKHLIKEGIAPQHLVAAGFGENQPISLGTSEEELAKNRRIEFKLDER
ncbi:MAG: peptidoglycan-binding protein [Holosporales bacterium]|jgi:chemotaxis protein MotB|nr:peptidoglycan-binding protein [Holosporales bacterium]